VNWPCPPNARATGLCRALATTDVHAPRTGVLDFELESEALTKLDSLTTSESLAEFRALYEKCVVRDTPLAGTPEGEAMVKRDITLA
jgi:hypothetical protein